MSLPISVSLRRFPFPMIISRGSGPHIISSLPSASRSVQLFRQFASFSKDCRPPLKLPLPCYHGLSNVGSGIINYCQTRSSAGPSSIVVDMYSKKKLYHTRQKATKARMLRRWDTWLLYRNLRQKQINQYFDLQYVLRIFDGIHFRGLLRDDVVVKWKDPKEMLGCLSRTSFDEDARRGPFVLIEIMKPPVNGPWTLTIIRERLGALRYEMARIYFQLHRRHCVSFQQSKNRTARGGRSGYGSSFKKFFQEVEQEANRIS